MAEELEKQADEIVDIPQDDAVSEQSLDEGPALDYGRPITRPPVLDVEEKS